MDQQCELRACQFGLLGEECGIEGLTILGEERAHDTLCEVYYIRSLEDTRVIIVTEQVYYAMIARAMVNQIIGVGGSEQQDALRETMAFTQWEQRVNGRDVVMVNNGKLLEGETLWEVLGVSSGAITRDGRRVVEYNEDGHIERDEPWDYYPNILEYPAICLHVRYEALESVVVDSEMRVWRAAENLIW